MRYISFIILLALFYSCSPQLYYLGDNYPPTSKVDTFYSPDDIKGEFKVIGQLTGTNDQELGSHNSLDEIKIAMIEEAKKRGANGILFLFADSFRDNHNVKADLLKYLD